MQPVRNRRCPIRWRAIPATGGLLVLSGLLLAGMQDPKPAVPPQEPGLLRPVDEPYVAPVLRGDIGVRRTPRDPIEGVWRLRSRVAGGRVLAPGEGYMMIGREHLMVHFKAPGIDPELPVMRSGTYKWTRSDGVDGVRMTALMSHYNDDRGDIVVESAGKVENRQFVRTDATLRVHQAVTEWLEFVRVE
jgi:hypothetical protein